METQNNITATEVADYNDLIMVVQKQTDAINSLHTSLLIFITLTICAFVCILFYRFMKLFY